MLKHSVILSGFLKAMRNNKLSSMKAPFENIEICTTDGICLQANHYVRGNSKVIIVAHGFYQNKDTKIFRSIAESFLPDFDVISIDFRGHGKSKGFFTLGAKEAEDLICFLKFAHARYKKIGVIGFSLGAATSIIAAGQTDLIHSLIAVSPPTTFWKIDCHFWTKEAVVNLIDNLSPNGHGKGVRLGNPFLRKPKPIEHIDRCKAPVLFIHGARDWLIRPNHSQKLYSKAKEPKRLKIIEDGFHAERIFEKFPSEFKNGTVTWFNETL